MMRSFIPVFAALIFSSMAVSADAPSAPIMPLAHSQRVQSSADGGVCTQVGETWRCRQFVVEEYSEPSGRYLETVFRGDQWRNWSNGYGYRHIECPVDRQALRVTPNHAVVQATVDADSGLCINYGEMVTFEPYSVERWLFTGLVTVEATLLDPTYEEGHVSAVTYEDHESGETRRENCHGGTAWRLNGGGMMLFGIYRAFGPGDADGSFRYETCGTTEK